MACDFGPSPDWVVTIFNLKHLICYGVLATAGFGALRERPPWHAAAVVLLITITVELEEAVFSAGHCRLRDVFPNLIAVGLGWLGARAAPDRSSTSHA